jgi:hypothetical protein
MNWVAAEVGWKNVAEEMRGRAGSRAWLWPDRVAFDRGSHA